MIQQLYPHLLPTAVAWLTLVAQLAAQESSSPTPSSSALSLHAADRSAAAIQRVLDGATNWLLLHHGYEESAEVGRFTTMRGVEDARSMVLELGGAPRRTFELAATPHPAGGWEVHVRGLEHGGAGATPNPDLAALAGRLRELLAPGDAATPLVTKNPPPPGPAPRPPPVTPGGRPAPISSRESFEFDLDRVAFEIVHLSYAQGDRVLGLLKALGYSTIEFVAQLGDADFEAVYEPLARGEARLPLVVKLIEASKTSIMDELPPLPGPPRPASIPSRDKPAVPDIGGRLLHQATTGEPLQRLLIVHDPDRPEALAKLRRLLREQIDVPARQIVLEALVIEIDSDRLRDLGVTFAWQEGKHDASFDTDAEGNVLPFTYAFDRSADFVRHFQASLHALVSRGHAEILTNPSVLVLDGRQARIQIGQQIPVVTSTATVTAVSQRVEYFPVGIVLNVRPRLDEAAGVVTLQVETIVSSVSSTGAATGTGDDAVFAPAIDNRQVQTFARIADNTPFIIGGLISTEDSEAIKGVPGLSKIPGLGALFRRKSKTRVKQEVIIVLTPHVVPLGDRSFGYAVPKESSAFDSFGHRLFRNAYRLRSQDIFDLSFLNESPDLRRLRASAGARARLEPELAFREPISGLLAGRVPGEEILVRRMLWEVIGEHDLEELVNPEHIIFFEPRSEGGFEVAFLHERLAERRTDQGEALVVAFEMRADGSAYAEPSWQPLSGDGFSKLLRRGNPLPEPSAPAALASLVLGERPGSTSTLDVLRRVLVLERVLELNTSLEMELDALHVGLQIILPSEEDLTQRFHLVDRATARLFFEVEEYYAAFEQVFDREIAAAFELLDVAK